MLDLPPHSTVSAAIESLASRFPDIRSDCRGIAFAVNRSYVNSEHELSDGDELALIPPVSGG